MKKRGPEDRCALVRLRKHWASLQAAPILSKICVSRTCFLKITSSHCQFACYGPNKKAYDRLEKYLLRISSKISLWSKFLQFPANSMSCSCSVPPSVFCSAVPLTFFSVGRFWQLSYFLSDLHLSDLGVVLVMGQMIWDACSQETCDPSVIPWPKSNPLSLTRHSLNLVKSMKISQEKEEEVGGFWNHSHISKSPELSSSQASIQFISCCCSKAPFRGR